MEARVKEVMQELNALKGKGYGLNVHDAIQGIRTKYQDLPYKFMADLIRLYDWRTPQEEATMLADFWATHYAQERRVSDNHALYDFLQRYATYRSNGSGGGPIRRDSGIGVFSCGVRPYIEFDIKMAGLSFEVESIEEQGNGTQLLIGISVKDSAGCSTMLWHRKYWDKPIWVGEESPLFKLLPKAWRG